MHQTITGNGDEFIFPPDKTLDSSEVDFLFINPVFFEEIVDKEVAYLGGYRNFGSSLLNSNVGQSEPFTDKESINDLK